MISAHSSLSHAGARDCFDMPISGADAAAAKAYDHYVFEFLSYGPELRKLFDMADAYPQCALANAHAATLHLAFEGAEGWTNAAPYLRHMRAARHHQITEREALYCDMVEAWARRDFHLALDIVDQLTVRWPADLCAIKWGQYHAFNLGDQAALLRFGQRARIAHENTPYAHGLIAFALEQDHQLQAAEDEGKRAVEIAIDDAWAHHAVAHVFETRQKVREGLRWMDHCAHTWEGKGVFIRDHNWWHTALFHLGNDDQASALEVFDTRLWGNWPEFPQEQIGAISLLWRLEILGGKPGTRWSPIVDQVRARAGEHILPFHDLHYVYALARAGAPGEAEAFLDSLNRYADEQTGPAAQIWQGVCAPLARGVARFAQENFSEAVTLMRPALANVQSIGGSHAQRQVFFDTYEYARSRLSGRRHAGATA
ncbi:MAG: tetratricopeptide repeat protein [Pseudomonadota bacterium]